MAAETVKDVKLTVDKAFADLIPATDEKEEMDLEEQIRREGKIREPIKFWENKGSNFIIDGHRRFKIYGKLQKEIPPPQVQEMFFPDRDSVVTWMIRDSISRRNLKPKELSLLRAKLVELTRKRQTQKATSENFSHENQGESNGQNVRNTTDSSESATEQVAKETGVSSRTARRDVEFAEQIEAIRAVNSKAAADIVSGALKITKSAVKKIAALDHDAIVAALKNLRAGRKWDDDGTKPPKQKKPKAARRDVDLDEGYVDDNRQEVPPELHEVWRAKKKFYSILGKLKDLAGEIRELRKEPGGARIHLSATAQGIEQAAKALALSMPSVVEGKKWLCVQEAK